MPAKKENAAIAALRALFPATAETVSAGNAEVQRNLAAGQVARGFGVGLRNAVSVPMAVVNDVVARPLNALLSESDAERNLASGLFGGGGAAAPARPAPARPVQVAAKPAAKAAAPALQPIPITPQMRAMAEINATLMRPHSRDEARAFMGMLPKPAQPATGANAIAEAGAAVAGQWFIQQQAAIEKLRQTDPDRAEEMYQSATKEYLTRLATFSRANPANMAQAMMLDQAAEQ